MQHFLQISDLATDQIQNILQSAQKMKNSGNYPKLSDQIVANLFYENSTRTLISFELAAKHLSMQVVNVQLQTSSEQKGEVIQDTLATLAAMGIQHFVIRHQQDGIPQAMADFLGNKAHIINAGDGKHAHPSQAMLDMLTILEHKPQLHQLKIAIVGNIKHSRVANSFQMIAKKLGVGQLSLIAPTLWQPTEAIYGEVTDNLRQGLADADVVMCLRVQKERLAEHEHLDLAAYRENFSLTTDSARFAKPDALIMHPGPMNRGIEIDSNVADGPQSVILQQVENGVYARMAILAALCQ
jgi:aspartate carbamoyltransferase catalytic subunit